MNLKYSMLIPFLTVCWPLWVSTLQMSTDRCGLTSYPPQPVKDSELVSAWSLGLGINQ
jgi:hypothetical protein